MTHPSVPYANTAIANLRALETDTIAVSGEHLVPDIYITWDAQNSGIEVKATAGEGDLVTLNATVDGDTGWFSFNIGLGEGQFEVGDVLGLVLEVGDGTPFAFRASILSSDDGALHWTELAEKPALDGSPRVVTLLHTIAAHDPIIAARTFHTLVCNLPHHDFCLSIKDMRFFVVGAARGLSAAPETLTSYAV